MGVIMMECQPDLEFKLAGGLPVAAAEPGPACRAAEAARA